MNNLKITKDKTNELKQILDKMKNMDVLVGIPQADDSRQGEGITNSELLFIQTNGIRKRAMRLEMKPNVEKKGYHKAHEMYIQAHGSPLWHVPPRPVIEPAIENDKEKIAELLKEALKATLDGDSDLAKEYLNKAGLEGQAASQDWFDNPSNGWAANSQETIKKKGSNKPLINTGELRKSITYILREEK
jgi:hypothetical protein